MTRLFDATSTLGAQEEARRKQEEVKRRAAEAEAVLSEIEELDEESQKLKNQLAQMSSEVTPIRYVEYRQPGSRWHIEHARAGDDHVFQMFPLKKPSYMWQDVITMMVGALDVIFPPDIHIHYVPPTPNELRPFYTVKVVNVAKTPGWNKDVLDRVLRALASVSAWETKTPTPRKGRA